MNTRSLQLLEINERDLVQLTGKLFISDGQSAPGPLTRWTHIGNTNKVEIDSGITTRESMVSIAGMRRPGRSHETGMMPKLKLTINEWTETATQLALAADPSFDFGSAGADNAASAISAQAGTAWNFDTGNAGVAIKKGQRTQIYNAAGKRVYAITALSLAGADSAYGAAGNSTTLAEGVDYEYDKVTGEVYWLKDISADVITPTITSAAITSTSNNYAKKMRAWLKGYAQRYFALYLYDQDDLSNLVLWSEDIFGRIAKEGTSTADGENDFENQLTINIFNDCTFFKRV